MAGGKRYEVTTVGVITFGYEASDKTVFYRNARANGTITTKVNGQTIDQQDMVGSIEPEQYECSGDTLRFWSANWTIEAAPPLVNCFDLK